MFGSPLVPSRVTQLSPTTAVALLSAAMASAAVALFTFAVPHHAGALLPGLSPPWWALALAFAAGEFTAVHLESRRSAFTVTFRDVPMVLGLAMLDPGSYLIAHLVGSGVALLVGRQSPLKLVFNASMITLEAMIAILVFRVVLAGAAPDEPRGWLAALAAVLLTDLLTAMAITAVIAMHDRRPELALLTEALSTGLVATVANVSLALVALSLLVTQPAALAPLVLACAVLYAVYRSYYRLSQRYARTELLYDFTRSVGEHVDEQDVPRIVLERVRTLLKAQAAELVILPGPDHPDEPDQPAQSGLRVRFDDSGHTRALMGPADPDSAPEWWARATYGHPVLISRTGRDGRGSPGLPGDGMAAPLSNEGRIHAVLTVTDRTSDVSTFGAEDLRLFTALAGHASVALANGHLVGQLRAELTAREHAATHDALTGMANRRGLLGRVPDLLAAGSGVLILVAGMDRFQDVNDALGHDFGDRLLQAVGAALPVLEGGFTARLGGDEFAVAAPVTGVEQAREIADLVRAAIAAPLVIDGLTIHTSATVGMAMDSGRGEDPAELLQHADLALAMAKRLRAGVQVYDPQEGARSRRRLALATDLRVALAESALEVWYQPQAEARTGQVVGVEALLRWRHPVFGSVSPDELIALAEQTGLMPAITEYVLRTTLNQRAAWAADGIVLDVAVNLSARDLMDPRLPDRVAGLLADSGCPATALTLEITEGTVMDDIERALDVLAGLSELDISLSIDDFGTGYSSLAYLARLPVDEVKIDKSFVMGMTDRDVIVGATIDLAHALGRRTVAEGVESPEVWERLSALGCDLIQGFGLLRPSPAHELTAWLAERTIRERLASVASVALR